MIVEILVALALSLGLLMSGTGVARLLLPSDTPTALGVIVAFATLLVLGVDGAALASFHPLTIFVPLAGLATLGLWAMLRGPRAGRALHPSLFTVLTLVTLAALVPLLILPVPMDTDAQGFGMLALTVRDGGHLDTLAPWRTGIGYLYSPGAPVLFATISRVAIGVPMSSVMMAVSHASVVLCVWLAWELGAELAQQSPVAAASQDTPASGLPVWPWATAVSAALSIGLWTALLDAHYTAVLGLTIVIGWLIAILRAFRTGQAADLAVCAVLIGAVAVTHVDSTVVLAAGVAAFALVGLRGHAVGRWLKAVIVPPIVALVLVSPWLLALVPALGTGMRSPYEVSLSHWRQFALYHGLIWPALSVVGFVIWSRSRAQWPLVMAVWVALVIDLSTFGGVARVTGSLTAPLLRFNYPFSVAWHGPVVPYIVLGAGAIAWLLVRTGSTRLPKVGGVTVLALVALTGTAIGLSQPLLRLTRAGLALHGAFSSSNDVLAMIWIREHTPSDARVLNYPGDYEHLRDWESHWAPVITERDCVYFRMQPFYVERPESLMPTSQPQGLAAAFEEQRRLLSVWRNPLAPTSLDLLDASRIGYVIVPESIGDPASLERAWRWQPPALLEGTIISMDRAPYLRLAYHAGGAKVFEVLRPRGARPLSNAD